MAVSNSQWNTKIAQSRNTAAQKVVNLDPFTFANSSHYKDAFTNLIRNNSSNIEAIEPARSRSPTRSSNSDEYATPELSSPNSSLSSFFTASSGHSSPERAYSLWNDRSLFPPLSTSSPVQEKEKKRPIMSYEDEEEPAYEYKYFPNNELKKYPQWSEGDSLTKVVELLERPRELPLPLRNYEQDMDGFNRMTSLGPRWKTLKRAFCEFCFKNKEPQFLYSSHQLKDDNGTVACPVLRNYQCPICHESGDKAHTLKYCPIKRNRKRGASAPRKDLPLTEKDMTKLTMAANNQISHAAVNSLFKKKNMCKFCFKNRKDPSVYTEHRLMTDDGEIECPFLRSFVCAICGATGNQAHTRKYCPENDYHDFIVSLHGSKKK